MTCETCGFDLSAGAQFCSRCGASLMNVDKAASHVQTVAPVAAATPNQDPRAARFFNSKPHVEAPVRVNGKRFVIHPGFVLPARCVKCSNHPSDPWIQFTFSWHHPALYVLVISPIIYIIVAAILRKRVRLAVPLCEAHRASRKAKLWLAAICLLGCIPVPVAIANVVNSDSLVGPAILLGVLMFLIGTILVVLASPLKVTYIGPESAEFSGATSSFLAEMARASVQST